MKINLLKHVGRLKVFFSLLILGVPILGFSINKTEDFPEEKLLIEVLDEISRDHQVYFTYDSDIIKGVTVDYEKREGESVHSILSRVLAEVNMDFKIFEERFVILYRKDEAGLKSLEQMISHMEEIVKDRKELFANRRVPAVAQLSTEKWSEVNRKRLVLNVTGRVMDSKGDPLIGVNVQVKGTNKGTSSDLDGRFSLNDIDDQAVLVVSYIGYKSQEVAVAGQTSLTIVMLEDSQLLDAVVVVGYGTQKRSDITGSVTSIPKERLELVPNSSIIQAMQGSIPGLSILTTSTGASPSQSLMIRGRNSIRASNDPLVVVDGVPGGLGDVNPNDVESIEILKDASAAAIYGSRGSNGVILVTTKKGIVGTPKVAYDGFYSTQSYINYPEYLDGAEFYEFKNIREPGQITLSEQKIYESGKWVDWFKEASRNGSISQHNLSVSGGSATTKYYISGNVHDGKGLAINDNYLRLTGRVNIDTKVSDWLTIGTRTSYSFHDRSGISPNYNYPTAVLSAANPLTTAYDENGDLTIFIWPEDQSQGNPLAPTLYDDKNISNQMVSNNFALIDVPFIQGLSYRINAGIRNGYGDNSTYIGRDTRVGLLAGGQSSTSKSRSNNTTIENIINYNKNFGRHNVFITGLYSYEHSNSTSDKISASGFPNDFLKIYATSQAKLVETSYGFSETTIISQMLRANYSYDSRYLLTITGRRDGYSGFGSNSKWGLFPSFAFGWNAANEEFFPWKNLFSELKPRFSYGLNGNQAIGAYETISRLREENHISEGITQAGYRPSVLGADNLGWESSKTFNLGVDLGILNNRITGNVDYFKTNTYDLLLNRSISPVQGITSIIQNIGKTENKGIELLINSRNIIDDSFQWNTTVNMSHVKNRIISLYGYLDDDGAEIDDVANKWFIGHPINVIYDYAWDGVWQLDEVDQAAIYGNKPGSVKLRDVNNDGKLNADDRIILGQGDPKFLWGLTNTFTYNNLSLSIFMHGVNGATRRNNLLVDGVFESVRQNTTKKNWWTPDNPTNEWIANDIDAAKMGGVYWEQVYENADFIRIKDVTLSYELPLDFIQRIGIDRLRLYANGRNLFTFTQFGGMDPELTGKIEFPLQRELVFGINLSF